MWWNPNASPPTVLTFDHPPTDAELQVPQPYRNPTGNVRLRKGSEVWTIENLRLPIWVVLLFALGMSAALIAILVQEGTTGTLWTLVPLSMFAAFMASAMWAADRAIVRQGPLVVYRRGDGELRIEGRDEPLSSADVTEIVELTLPYRGWGVGKPDHTWALYLIVHRRDGVYTVERLYHGQPSGRATWDAAPPLANALGVAYRRIELGHRDPVLSPFGNTRPPKPRHETTRK